MKQSSQAATHPTEDQLESYALGRLVEPELGRVETHLFVCHNCQDALLETDEYHALMKSALAEPIPESVPLNSRMKAWGWAILDSLQFPRPLPVLSGALAALAIGVMLSQTNTAGLAARESEVTLRATRGGAEATLAAAPAHAALRLKIESTYLTSDQDYQAQIVDAAGKTAWQGPAPFAPGQGVLVHVDKRLAAGIYWVRLHNSERKLLQEYGLQLR